MTRALIFAAVSTFALAVPALAQQAGTATAPAPAAAAAPADPLCPPEHAAMGHCTPKSAAPAHPVASPSAPTAAPAVDPACPPEHAAMGHCTPKAAVPTADPNASSTGVAAATPTAPPIAPPPPAALSGPENAADALWDPKLMADKRAAELIDMHGGMTASKVLLDRLEYRAQDGRDGYAWDGEAWYGGDYDRLWLKTEGEGAFGDALEEAEVQALYSRAIDPWFNLQAGVRYDIRPKPDRAHLVVGIQGLAPYWFEVDGALFLSDEGDLTARFEAEYDQRITNRLILQPRVELDLAAQDLPEIGIGAGLSSLEAGLRLRYEIVPEFAPYAGVQYERRFGHTADFARAAGEDAGGWAFLAGLRSWF
jgi:copper resistance protein B